MRRKTREVLVGGLAMGGTQPVRVQTMTTTNTLDVASSVAQCKRIADAGADYVRLTTQGLREVEALAQIKQQLRAAGYTTPLIADVHFTPKVALAAAAVADKVRINPGNFGHTYEEAETQLLQLIDICRQHGTVLRIGVNHGSLAERIVEEYGDSPQGMLASAMEFLHICRNNNFHEVVVSMKSSNTRVMVEAYRLLVAAMDAEKMNYPLHLGVTEAGDGDDGRIKSAVGIGTLLAQGFGDTIRVSLTEAPENEIPVAQALVQISPQYPLPFTLHPLPIVKKEALQFHYNTASREELLLRLSCQAGPLLLDGYVNDVHISAAINGKPLEQAECEELAATLLQAARVRFSKPEYIACPGCGRTLFDLQPVLAAVRAATTQLKGLKIAVMGCIVNGPGEMADADYGYVGAGPGLITLYKGKTPVKKNISQQSAVEELIALIKESGDFIEETI
ncbi:MAG: (E)-4-hydroxy-3-methylbut-2-enyl-diphosphate synthase [Prevotellaceae bacterium]|nr:(E)-4-hydroxy-3-methylbut-2-enyl-diphosphate synthase [Prevotellaceae bacterium]